MTTQEQEIFHEMLAALQDVVNWYGAPTQGDAPAIAAGRGGLHAPSRIRWVESRRRRDPRLVEYLFHSGGTTSCNDWCDRQFGKWRRPDLAALSHGCSIRAGVRLWVHCQSHSAR